MSLLPACNPFPTGLGKLACAVFDDLVGDLFDVAAAALVAERIGDRFDFVEAGVGDVLQAGEPVEELAVDARYTRHLGLVEHDLGDHDAVRVAGAAPG